jgi:tripeptidyl-peptidase-1
MKYSLVFSALVAAALAAPSAHHVLHEKRNRLPSGWEKRAPLAESQVLPMKIALSQSNLDKLDDMLMQVSHPESDKYGKHWNAKEIAEAFAPSHETVRAVKEWLAANGIAAHRVKQSQSLGWLEFSATVAEAESLLKTKYHAYEHASGKPHVACDEYHVPQNIQEHVDFITPTVHFDAKVNPSPDEPEWGLKKRTGPIHDVHQKEAAKVGLPSSGSLPKQGAEIEGITDIFKELKNCDKSIVPDCLKALYNIPPILANHQGNEAYGIVEYSPQAFLQSDLDMFFANFTKDIENPAPIFLSIDGGVAQTQNQSFDLNGESNLDLEYGMSLHFLPNKFY